MIDKLSGACKETWRSCPVRLSVLFRLPVNSESVQETFEDET